MFPIIGEIGTSASRFCQGSLDWGTGDPSPEGMQDAQNVRASTFGYDRSQLRGLHSVQGLDK